MPLANGKPKRVAKLAGVGVLLIASDVLPCIFGRAAPSEAGPAGPPVQPLCFLGCGLEKQFNVGWVWVKLNRGVWSTARLFLLLTG